MVRTSFIAILTIAFAIGISATSSVLTKKESQQAVYSVTVPPLAQYDPRIIDIATFGFRGLYDNFVEIWMIQYLVDSRSLSGDSKVIFDTVMRTFKANIRRFELYTLVCAIFDQEYKQPELCEPISLKGLELFPTNFQISTTQGWAHLRLQEFEKAAKMFKIASEVEGAPQHIKNLSDRLDRGTSIDRADLEKLMKTLNKNPALQNFHKKRMENGE